MRDDPASAPPTYQRAQLSALTGVNAETLRFYEKAGLLAPARAANGYRLYTEDDVKRLKLIRRALAAGFAIDRIKPLLDGDPAAIQAAIHHIEALGEELDKLRKALRKRLRD